MAGGTPDHAALEAAVEVLSASTEDYERGDKFEHYKRLPSLKEYVLVSHSERAVEAWTRLPDGSWSQRLAKDGEQLRLERIDTVLDVSELYDAAREPSS